MIAFSVSDTTLGKSFDKVLNMKFHRYLLIFLSAFFIFSNIAHAEKKYVRPPQAQYELSPNHYFIDLAIGYAIQRPELKHSFDANVFGVTKNNGAEHYHQNSAIYSAALGYEINNGFAVKIETSYNPKFNNIFSKLVQDPDYEEYIVITDQASTRIVLDAEYNFAQFDRFNLFVDAGAGLAMNHTDEGKIYGLFSDINAHADDQYIRTIAFSNNSFTWHVGTGIKYQASDKLSFSVHYKYIDYGYFKSSSRFYRYSASVDGGSYGRLSYDPQDRLKFKLTSHNIMIGARIKL